MNLALLAVSLVTILGSDLIPIPNRQSRVYALSTPQAQTFLQIGTNLYSAATGWHVVRADSEIRKSYKQVTPHGSVELTFSNGRDTFLFHISSSLAGEWPGREIHCIPFPGSSRVLTNYTINLLTWATNGTLTSAVVDFDGGKLRLNSAAP